MNLCTPCPIRYQNRVFNISQLIFLSNGKQKQEKKKDNAKNCLIKRRVVSCLTSGNVEISTMGGETGSQDRLVKINHKEEKVNE